MSSEIYDLTLPAHDPAITKPRGLLTVPSVVQEAIAGEEARFAREHGYPFSAEARERMTNDLTLQHYFEGSEVACRETPQGVEVLAVGDEISAYLRSTPLEEQCGVLIRWP
jgi:hypothetical protein